MDLGGRRFQTFRLRDPAEHRHALLAGAMLAFAFPSDEVIVTTFTAGQQSTLPIWMLEELIRPRSAPGDQRRRHGRRDGHLPADSSARIY